MKLCIHFMVLAIMGLACQQTSQTAVEAEPESDSTLPEQAAQPVPYGNNPDAGSYFEIDGVKLYYEVYGEGAPILMLHGGIYGYIDEFTPFIPKLAETHKVICLATRGHGKSEIGKEPFTYEQRARDAYQLLQHLEVHNVLVIGFSDGGYSALKMAALYPEAVRKVIAMGVGDRPKGEIGEPVSYSSESLMKEAGGFFQERLSLMPEPDRWQESLDFGSNLYNNDFMRAETFSKIQCPVLLMNGEKDHEVTIDNFIQVYKHIPEGHLSIIPQCGHVIFYCNFNAVWESMVWFL